MFDFFILIKRMESASQKRNRSWTWLTEDYNTMTKWLISLWRLQKIKPKEEEGPEVSLGQRERWWQNTFWTEAMPSATSDQSCFQEPNIINEKEQHTYILTTLSIKRIKKETTDMAAGDTAAQTVKWNVTLTSLGDGHVLGRKRALKALMPLNET